MGQIKVEKNVGGIEGLCVIEPAVHGDARGYFMETYNEKDMKEAGIDVHFVQDIENERRSQNRRKRAAPELCQPAFLLESQTFIKSAVWRK